MRQSSMLELLGCMESVLNSAYYTQESALADFYDCKGCFHEDSPLTTAFRILQEQTKLSGGDLVVLLFDGQAEGGQDTESVL